LQRPWDGPGDQRPGERCHPKVRLERSHPERRGATRKSRPPGAERCHPKVTKVRRESERPGWIERVGLEGAGMIDWSRRTGAQDGGKEVRSRLLDRSPSGASWGDGGGAAPRARRERESAARRQASDLPLGRCEPGPDCRVYVTASAARNGIAGGKLPSGNRTSKQPWRRRSEARR